MFAVFRAQVGFHDPLPRRTRGRVFSDPNECAGDLPESLTERFHKQFLLAPEMLVKASVGETGGMHDGRNRGPSQAFGANAPRGVFDNLLMDLDFMLGSVAHGSL